jgi:predicted nucleic acid-binding protein
VSRHSLVYLDSSAIVKLVIQEPETQVLLRNLSTRRDRVGSALLRVEVPRAARRARASNARLRRLDALLDHVALIAIDDAVLEAAAAVTPAALRALDAIHLATALTVQRDLEELVTYDARLARAATDLGIKIVTPA